MAQNPDFYSKQLRLAILSAYPSKTDLEILIADEFNENLDAIAGGNNNTQIVFNLIKWAKSQGKFASLVEVAYQNNPNNEKLQEFYRQWLKSFVGKSSRKDRDLGPDFDWRGITDERVLQSWFKPEPELLDIGFLRQAIAHSASVCRVEISNFDIVGTGVLIGDRQVLTNYHVLQLSPDLDFREIARRTVLRFGCYTSETGDELSGQVFQLDRDRPILDSSPTRELDYVLLNADEKIKQFSEIQPASLECDRLPEERMGLNILQHPEGGSMKIAISTNGITGVYKESGLIQYVTKTAGGSSGAPCFNEDWQLVALHHAQRARVFGTIREGILLNSIYSRIQSHLK